MCIHDCMYHCNTCVYVLIKFNYTFHFDHHRYYTSIVLKTEIEVVWLNSAVVVAPATIVNHMYWKTMTACIHHRLASIACQALLNNTQRYLVLQMIIFVLRYVHVCSYKVIACIRMYTEKFSILLSISSIGIKHTW